MLSALRSTVTQLLLPRCCIGCGEAVVGREQSREWGYLCPRCAVSLRRVGEEACISCAKGIYGQIVGERICADCKTTPPSWTQARALVRYVGAAKRWVRDYKYADARYLERDWARMLNAPGYGWVGDFLSGAIVVPVPLHPLKQLMRGFNQSQQLAQLLVAESGATEAIVMPLVRRVRYTRQQARLPRSQRAKNVKNAFDINKRIALDNLQSRRVVVIDDLLTTGSTLSACVQVLKHAGFVRIDVLTFARG